MPKSQYKGFRIVIDQPTPKSMIITFEEITKSGTLQRSRKGLNEVTGGDYVGNLRSLPGTPEEIINETCGEEPGTLLSDRTFQTILETDIISGDNGDESNPEGFKGDVIKNMVRDLVDRIVVSINSSKRILDRAYKYKGYKPEEKK